MRKSFLKEIIGSPSKSNNPICLCSMFSSIISFDYQERKVEQLLSSLKLERIWISMIYSREKEGFAYFYSVYDLKKIRKTVLNYYFISICKRHFLINVLALPRHWGKIWLLLTIHSFNKYSTDIDQFVECCYSKESWAFSVTFSLPEKTSPMLLSLTTLVTFFHLHLFILFHFFVRPYIFFWNMVS